MGERVDWWDDPGEDVELHPERAARTHRRSVHGREPGLVDLVATILLLGVAVLASPLAWFAVVIGEMAFAACSDPSETCDHRAGDAVHVWHPIVTTVVLVLGSAWAVRRRARRRTAWPVALGTLLGVFIVFVAATVTIQVATGGHLL